jgi:hypothetical protein
MCFTVAPLVAVGIQANHEHAVAWRPRWGGTVYGGTGNERRETEEMTTLENRPHTALLVIDVQNGVVAAAHERDRIVANMGRLIEKARGEQVPVVWVQHSDEQLVEGSEEWQIVPELLPNDAEPLAHKNYGDSFEDTGLETILSDLGVGRVVVGGAQTDACVRSTLHGPFVRGYDATLASDAHTTETRRPTGLPRRTRSSPTPTCTGRISQLPGERPARSRPGRSTSAPRAELHRFPRGKPQWSSDPPLGTILECFDFTM